MEHDCFSVRQHARTIPTYQEAYYHEGQKVKLFSCPRPQVKPVSLAGHSTPSLVKRLENILDTRFALVRSLRCSITIAIHHLYLPPCFTKPQSFLPSNISRLLVFLDYWSGDCFSFVLHNGTGDGFENIIVDIVFLDPFLVSKFPTKVEGLCTYLQKSRLQILSEMCQGTSYCLYKYTKR